LYIVRADVYDRIGINFEVFFFSQFVARERRSSGVSQDFEMEGAKSKKLLKKYSKINKNIYFYFYNNCLDFNILI